MPKKAVTKAAPAATANLPTAPWRDAVKSATAVAIARGVGASEFASLSLRGGRISYKDRDLGKSMEVVILAAIPARTYYVGAYQPGDTSPPDCYSNDGLTPHPSVQHKQASVCVDCPLNQFGSADNERGKACKEGFKLALLSADDVRKGKIESAEIAQVKFSVSASKVLSNYLNVMAARYDGVTFAVVTLLEVETDSRFQYSLELSVVEALDPDTIDQLGARFADATRALSAPYAAPAEGTKKLASKKLASKKGPVRRTKY